MIRSVKPAKPAGRLLAPPRRGWRRGLQAGCWRRRAGDGGGAEGDDAAVSPVTGSAPPSPAQCSARVPPSAAGCLVRVVCAWALLCWLLVVQLLLTWWEWEKGSWAGPLGRNFNPTSQADRSTNRTIRYLIALIASLPLLGSGVIISRLIATNRTF